MSAVLLRLPGRDPFDLDSQTEPPHGQLTEPVEGLRGRERHAVVGPNHLRQAKLLEGALKDREGKFLLRGEERLARQEVATGEVGDRQRIAVLAIAEEKLAFVVRTPEHIRLGRPGERGPGRATAAPTPMVDQAVAIEDGVDRADRRQVRTGELLPELFTDLGGAPARILPLQAHDRGLDGRRQPIRLPVRAVAAIAEGLDPAVFVAVEDLVARRPGDPELGAQRRHLLALEQAGDKPKSLVHDVTLLPRHAPSA